MRAESSKSSVLNVTRRPSRKISTSEEEIELKRARGEISCAECRRLKLRCDKKPPCGSCVRRGCPTICPNGSLSTGQGARFVLADTEHLHHKISKMGQRIRSLEDAVSIFQAGVSNERHPLLTEELLSIKFGLEVSPRESSRDQSTVPISGMGTLTITERGDSHYFGRTAGSETLFMAGAELSGTEAGSTSAPTADLLRAPIDFNHLVTIPGIDDEDKASEVLISLLNHLPPYPRATTLCETYMENAAWIFRPITREELIDDILAPVYAFAQDEKKDLEVERDVPPHTVAVLFMVFAHGALTDLTLPPFNPEAENYFHLARLALSLQSVYELPTCQTLQALYLMAFFYANRGGQPTLDSAWSVMALANKLAQSMGLHRDPARFSMPPKAIQQRRTLFWELLTADMVHCMALGRPPSINFSYVDCEFPEDDTATINEKGEAEMGYFCWKYSFMKDVFIPVLELTLTVTPPSYETILELDRKVREKVLPPSLNLYRSSSIDEYTTPTAYTRGRLLFQLRSSTMMFVHRSFFAQAMLDFPSNPLRSPFAPSVLASYRGASAIIKTIGLNFQKFPQLFSRFWPMWTNLLTAAIIVGTIATRAPSSPMAPAAQLELDLALDIFRRGAPISPRARSGLAVLMSLKQKAQQAQVQSPTHGSASVDTNAAILLPETGVDELAVFGGQTRILVTKILTQQRRRKVKTAPPSISGTASAASSPSSMSDDSYTHSDPIPEVHPSLVEYLSMFPPPTMPSTMTMDASSIPTQFQIDQNSAFQSNMYTSTMSSTTAGSSSPNTFIPTTSSPNFDEQFMTRRDFADINFSGSLSSTGAAPNVFSDLELMISGESSMDQSWMTLMQDVLNPPSS